MGTQQSAVWTPKCDWLRSLARLWGSFLNPRNVAKIAQCRPLSSCRTLIRSKRTARALYTALRFTRECATPPYIHITSTYVTCTWQVYLAFPRVSTASDKRWGEKTWEQGYIPLPCWIYLEYLFQHFLMVEMALIGINFFWCETAEVRCNRLQDFQQCELIGIQFHAGSARPSSPFRVSVREGLAARLHSRKTSS